MRAVKERREESECRRVERTKEERERDAIASGDERRKDETSVDPLLSVMLLKV